MAYSLHLTGWHLNRNFACADSVKPMNSRAKGCRGEREFRDILREHGFLKAYRTMQYCGRNPAGGDCDVTCPELPGIHWEVKRVEAGNPYIWLAQARRDAAGETDVTSRIPVVAHKRNHSYWLAILPMSSFLEVLRRSDLVEQANGG